MVPKILYFDFPETKGFEKNLEEEYTLVKKNPENKSRIKSNKIMHDKLLKRI